LRPMDDLLIVRLSDRSKERFARREDRFSLGGALGLALGLPLGLAFAAGWQGDPTVGLAIGGGAGLALGTALGRFLPTPARHPRPSRGDLYEGLPIEDESETRDSDDEEPDGVPGPEALRN